MSFIGVVCGLKSEARVVDRAVNDTRVRVGVSGANAKRAEEIADQFVAAGARALFSVGVSGGLDPKLHPGDLIIADAVIDAAGEPLFCDERLLESIPVGDARGARGRIFGSDLLITGAAEKARLFESTMALAVDMESHGAARVSARANIPFLAVRAIADPADRALPSAAANAVAPDGSTRVLKTIEAAMRDPKQFPELMKLGADSAAALKTLRGNLGPIFQRLYDALDL